MPKPLLYRCARRRVSQLPYTEEYAPCGVTTPWRLFVSVHLNTMVACDFFCKTIWTATSKHVAYCLAFIHLGSRRVFVSPGTYTPTGDWVQQQAHNLSMWLEDEGLGCDYLIHDHDTKFTKAFDHLLEAAGAEIVRTPFQVSIANCFAESWIGTLKRECLNQFVCFGLRHLDHITQTYTSYYNELRPHQSLGNVPLGRVGQPPPKATEGKIGPVRRRAYLGGLLNHYERRAA